MSDRNTRPERASAEPDVGQQDLELATLYEVTRLLTSTAGVQTVLDVVAEAAARTLNAAGCSLRLVDRTGTFLEVSAAYGLSREYMDKPPVPIARSEIDQALLSGEVVTIDDVTTDPRVLYRDKALQEGLRSALYVGMISKDNPVGSMRVYWKKPHVATAGEVRLLRALANQAATSIENARLWTDRRDYERQWALGAEIQRGLLPTELPTVRGLELGARAEMAQGVGGDLYDFIPIANHNLGIAVGDASGKNLPAAILMASVRGALRAHVEDVFSVSDIMRRLNRSLIQATRVADFMTLFYGVYSEDERAFTYCNAGHEHPVLIRADGEQLLGHGGLLLGVSPDAVYDEGRVMLTPGDVILFFTDGVTETPDPQGRLFGRHHLVDLVRSCLPCSAQQIVDRLFERLREFAGGTTRYDDITVVAARATED